MRSVLGRHWVTACRVLRSRWMLAGAITVSACVAARAEDGPGPLVLTVRPSGVDAGPAGQPGTETLDARLARRDKMVRYICLGCTRADGRVDDTPFWPIRTLNAPQLNAALDGQP